MATPPLSSCPSLPLLVGAGGLCFNLHIRDACVRPHGAGGAVSCSAGPPVLPGCLTDQVWTTLKPVACWPVRCTCPVWEVSGHQDCAQQSQVAHVTAHRRRQAAGHGEQRPTAKQVDPTEHRPGGMRTPEQRLPRQAAPHMLFCACSRQGAAGVEVAPDRATARVRNKLMPVTPGAAKPQPFSPTRRARPRDHNCRSSHPWVLGCHSHIACPGREGSVGRCPCAQLRVLSPFLPWHLHLVSTAVLRAGDRPCPHPRWMEHDCALGRLGAALRLPNGASSHPPGERRRRGRLDPALPVCDLLGFS